MPYQTTPITNKDIIDALEGIQCISCGHYESKLEIRHSAPLDLAHITCTSCGAHSITHYAPFDALYDWCRLNNYKLMITPIKNKTKDGDQYLRHLYDDLDPHIAAAYAHHGYINTNGDYYPAPGCNALVDGLKA